MKHIKEMEEVDKQINNQDLLKKVDISYALGKSYEDLKNYEKAFHYLNKANQLKFDKFLGKTIKFTQDNHSFSNLGVLRGLHYQLEPKAQAKLVRCTKGEVFDVLVDIRKDSITFGQWVGAKLSSKNKNQLWVPIGFAHGFLVLSDLAEVNYKVSGFWNKSCERSLLWNDKEIDIKWPLDQYNISKPLLSEKDINASTLFEVVLINYFHSLVMKST